MAKNKTNYTDHDVTEFIHSFVEHGWKKEDSFRLVELLREWSGEEPRMWGPSIIGFGNYHYKYARGHEGDAPVLGFSPRKSALALYVYSDTEKSKQLLKDLGKFKMGKACIYVKRLEDINLDVLKELSKESIRFLGKNYESSIRPA